VQDIKVRKVIREFVRSLTLRRCVTLYMSHRQRGDCTVSQAPVLQAGASCPCQSLWKAQRPVLHRAQSLLLLLLLLHPDTSCPSSCKRPASPSTHTPAFSVLCWPVAHSAPSLYLLVIILSGSCGLFSVGWRRPHDTRKV
jgi:hypothetical protein